jgi:hypothetical protein
MGTGYSEADVLDSPATMPSGSVRRALDEHDPALAATEREIRAHRLRSLEEYAPVLSKHVADALRKNDESIGQAASDAEVRSAARRAQVMIDEFSDAPVLPATRKPKALTDQEMRERDRLLRIQLRQDEKSLVPVMRKPRDVA